MSSRPLKAIGRGCSTQQASSAEALADQIKAALNDLGKTLSEQEGKVENTISGRPSPRLLLLLRLALLSASCWGDTKVNTENVVKHLRVL
jgi:hypothetical protein